MAARHYSIMLGPGVDEAQLTGTYRVLGNLAYDCRSRCGEDNSSATLEAVPCCMWSITCW